VRILQISSAKAFGGGERHLVDLSRELAARGHEVFVALRPTNEWQDRLSFIPAERFMHVSIRNSFGTFSARRIASFVEANSIEIVHAHVARDYLTSSIACRIAKRPKLTITRHVTLPLKPFHRFALRNVDAAIAVSPGIKTLLERTFDRKRITTIQNGVCGVGLDPIVNHSLGADFRTFHNIPINAPVVAAIGELKVLKGQRDLVLAANEVVKRIPNCHFVLAGRDHSLDQKFRRELRRLVRVLGLEKNFLWLDWLDDVAPLLAAADVFVSASHMESFGLSILEAMAAATPVVATETEGARELLQDKEVLVKIKDPIALAEKICQVLQDQELRRSLGENQQRAAAEMFSLTSMIDATEQVYLSVLKR
jgi:L-malate glycosyltransferase